MSQGSTYDVDIMLCVDCTGSMAPYIRQVKEQAIKLPDDIMRHMAALDKGVDKFRVGVVAYGDYSYDGDESMRESSFFEMPAQAADYQAWVNGITLVNGGDEPESGQEALATAMRSAWSKGSDKRRHVIVVLSDASTHELGRARGQANYPEWMPADLNALTDWWMGQSALMEDDAKRLLIFAPDGNGWSQIAANWNNTAHVQTRAGEGLADQNYEEILAAVAKSV